MEGRQGLEGLGGDSDGRPTLLFWGIATAGVRTCKIMGTQLWSTIVDGIAAYNWKPILTYTVWPSLPTYATIRNVVTLI